MQGAGRRNKQALFRNKKFMFDEMTRQRNASKFAIILEYENAHSFFSFFISCYFLFPLINALEGLCQHIDQGGKVARNEKTKNAT